MINARNDWLAPGPHEVAPGVFRIPLPMPEDGLRAVNVYAIVSRGGVVLIDAGWATPEAENQLADALNELGFGLEHITDFLITHAHRDHYTLGVRVRRRHNTRISIGAHERVSIEELAHRRPYAEPRQVAILQRAGADSLAEAMRDVETPFDNGNWLPPDRWLDDRETITLPDHSELTVVHTPGHTRGHVTYLDPARGVLFAGDHVLPHITPSIGFEQVPTDTALEDFLASLSMLRAMPDTRLLPAHGPIAPSVHERVEELLEHHAKRLELTLLPLAQRPQTAYQVAQQLSWTRRERSLCELDPFNQCLATLETIAHLETLLQRGHVTQVTDSTGPRRYRLDESSALDRR